MSLLARYKERYPDQFVIETSNPRDETATTAGDPRIQFACDDVQGLLEVYAGVVYDETDARIVAVAVEGVAARLLVLTGQARASDKWNAWIESARSLGTVTGRNKVLVETSTPDIEDEFSNDKFADYLAESPTGTSDDGED